MANFLRDYINHRGMDTIIRTIYGILDKDTGEHLVPVQHANRYFSDLEIITIYNLPNQGWVDYDGSGIPGGDKKPKAPFWKFLTVNGAPIPADSVPEIDATIPTVISGTCTVENASEDTEVVVSKFDINETAAGVSPSVTEYTWSWTGNLGVENTEAMVHIEGLARNSYGDSPTAATEQRFMPYGALQITRDLDGTAKDIDVGQPAAFSIDVYNNSAPTPWVCELLFNGNVKETSSTPSFSIASISEADAGTYQIRFKDGLNRTILSKTDTYSVVSPMVFTKDLDNGSHNIVSGSTIDVDVSVSGGKAPLSYQWKKGALSVGTNSNKYTKANAQTSDSGIYTCEVTDSSATPKKIASKITNYTVYAPLSWKVDIPTETRTPAIGEEITLTVELQGGMLPYTYTWWRDYGGHEGRYPGNSPTVTFTVDETPVTYYCVGECNINGEVVSINSGRVTIEPVTP